MALMVTERSHSRMHYFLITLSTETWIHSVLLWQDTISLKWKGMGKYLLFFLFRWWRMYFYMQKMGASASCFGITSKPPHARRSEQLESQWRYMPLATAHDVTRAGKGSAMLAALEILWIAEHVKAVLPVLVCTSHFSKMEFFFTYT